MKKYLYIVLLIVASTLLVACKSDIAVVDLVVNPVEINLLVDSEIQVEVDVLPADSTNKMLIFEISDKSVATSTSSGLVKAIAVGNTVLKVSVKDNDNIFKNIIINVVETLWPNEFFNEHFDVNIPEFPNYASLTIVESSHEMIEFIVSGINNDEEALASFSLLLEADGWEKSINSNAHAGSFIKGDIELSYHNSTSHGQNQIEFVLAYEGHDHDHDHH